jgi:hypothetical protein
VCLREDDADGGAGDREERWRDDAGGGAAVRRRAFRGYTRVPLPLLLGIEGSNAMH